jgi:hypothetical protein
MQEHGRRGWRLKGEEQVAQKVIFLKKFLVLLVHIIGATDGQNSS